MKKIFLGFLIFGNLALSSDFSDPRNNAQQFNDSMVFPPQPMNLQVQPLLTPPVQNQNITTGHQPNKDDTNIYRIDSKYYFHPWHECELKESNLKYGWNCNCPLEGGCQNGYKECFSTSDDIKRWRCKKCDFDLCDPCYKLTGKTNRYGSKLHPNTDEKKDRCFIRCFINNDWVCNNPNCRSGMTQFYQSSDVERYKCACRDCNNGVVDDEDWDLCYNCLFEEQILAGTMNQQIPYSPLSLKMGVEPEKISGYCNKCKEAKNGMYICVHYDNEAGHVCKYCETCESIDTLPKECTICDKPVIMPLVRVFRQ